ncbi:MAG: Rieske 2Fe-2S domain-containing protein [Acidobacteria bacterium]|nr:Rieske 2Fe-2S domain-containing protein [Acidobacteriota bacterium]MXZ37824.1 Rieske 2Fe-2S domain-containing protein [Holophagales bacterium]MYF05537.1 Rieske 2Fe-2S domain-containing protein [Holophagales bacterium]MYJ25810.1 Rieske 2Fe-2S domain-containing protein [Holophagales bacterium]
MISKPDRPPLSPHNELPPFPEGWYLVASRESIQREKLIEKTWLGEEIVAWCDDEGRICVADAFCPHLGSHMGPTVGGVVRDGCLVCPFHGFTFDSTGRCVATPNAPAPSAAKLKVYATREVLGMVFAWWGYAGRPAHWHLPEDPLAGPKWSELRSCVLRFRGHPQETTENSVDIEHLGYTHGYSDVRPVGSTLVQGAYLRSCFDFKAVRRVAGLVDVVSEVSAVTHVHGLGYSFVEFHEKTIGMKSRLWVLATPVDGTVVDVTLVSQVREIRKPGRFFVGFGFLPVSLRHRLMNRLVLREERRFVQQDVVIWERKRYQAPPRLSQADGPVGKYRQYSRQFYPELESQRRPALSVV